MKRACLLLLCSILWIATVGSEESQPWPPAGENAKPWTYWWWMASAVDPANITRELERYRDAGLGGVHIIPIYGAKGFEDRYIDYLSPKWMEMLRHTVTEAQRLGLGVDMTTGTGWCFGGPQITADQANALPVVQTFEIAAGGKIPPGKVMPKPQALMAFPQSGAPVDLLEKLRQDGEVDWISPEGEWTVYAVGQKPSGQKVKRSGPGGAGHMLNPFSPLAIESFLQPYTAAFAGYDGPKPRAQYHDSYEYRSEWASELFAAFEKRRGYRLQDELPALLGKGEPDRIARVKGDYRETLSDLMIEESFPKWIRWSHEHGFITRNEAHGSPGNLLDLYSLADIPETEMFFKDRSPLMAKFASSAAHVNGRTLVSCETGTWVKEHFHETLGDVKSLVDELLVSGVNHVFFHGTCYSTDEAGWPGWLFYASTQMNPRNSIWHDAPALNDYIARCQAALRMGKSDNDVLLYWPIHDLWHDPQGMVQGLTVHAAHEWLLEKAVGKAAAQLWQRGYGFDYVSDRQIARARVLEGAIETAPGAAYRGIVVPKTEHLPVSTLEMLLKLAEGGATVIFEDAAPSEVPGLSRLEERRSKLRSLADSLAAQKVADGSSVAPYGKGRVIMGDLAKALTTAAIKREALVDHAGLLFIRRVIDGDRLYFLNNRSETPVDSWVPLASKAPAVEVMDPLTGKTGFPPTRATAGGGIAVRLQLAPGATLILRTRRADATRSWPAWERAGESFDITGKWQVEFLQGGPVLPFPATMAQPGSWTALAGPAESFAGTARYTITFDAPADSTGAWTLNLGDVCQSARIRLNGRDLGTLIQRPFVVHLDALQPKSNKLEVEVTNVAANRIRDLDRRGVVWRTFNDINFVNIDYKPFDASNWPLEPSGLIGPVRLIPLKPADLTK